MRELIFNLQLFGDKSGTNTDDFIENNESGISILTYAGNDTVLNTGENVTIDTGDGDNYVDIDASNVTIKSGSGNDLIYDNDNSNVVIDVGGGDDSVHLDNTNKIFVDAGEGNNGEHYLYTLVNSAIDSAQIEFERIAAEESRKNLGNSRKDYLSNKFKPNIDENLKFKDRKTGFENLDEKLKFFLPGVYVISGLPALGKTSFALQLLNQMAESGETCIFVSYEMSEQFLYCKLLAREVYKIESEKIGAVKFPLTATDIMMKNINDFHKDAFNKAFEILTGNDAPLYIWEEKEIDVPKLLERIKKVCKQLPKPPIVCIDYLQLLGAGSDKPKSAIDDALRHFFNFRRETNTTFILISSLNRANYNTDANIASLKESGGIEYSADAIFFLQYLLESRTHADADEAMKKIPREIQLKCLKYRFGRRFDIGFFYYPNADFFKPMDIESYSDWNQNQETSNKFDIKKKIIYID